MAVAKLAGKTKIVATRVLGSPAGEPPFHRIAEVYFPSMEALEQCAAGAAGYGRYHWHSFADNVGGNLMTEAVVPTLTGEDPRCYSLGRGGFVRRAGYSISGLFLTRTDGKWPIPQHLRNRGKRGSGRDCESVLPQRGPDLD
jgi:hypothetical protein